MPEGLSPATISRLTLIQLDPPRVDEFEAEYSALLARRIGRLSSTLTPADCARCVLYMFDVLRLLESRHAKIARRQTLRRLLQWCDYVRLDRSVPGCRLGSFDAAMANLALGGHVLLLDQLDPAARAAMVAALADVETRYSETALDQHADPDPNRGHYDRFDEGCGTWLTTGTDRRQMILSYLGFHLGGGAEAPADTVYGFGGFEPSFSAVRNLSRVLIARDTGHAINLVGPPGIGKSAVAEVAATLLGRPFTRISCSRSLTVDDLFGSYRPTLDQASGQILFLFQPGPLARAIAAEGLVLLDELNLAPADVLGVLCGLLSARPDEPYATRN